MKSNISFTINIITLTQSGSKTNTNLTHTEAQRLRHGRDNAVKIWFNLSVAASRAIALRTHRYCVLCAAFLNGKTKNAMGQRETNRWTAIRFVYSGLVYGWLLCGSNQLQVVSKVLFRIASYRQMALLLMSSSNTLENFQNFDKTISDCSEVSQEIQFREDTILHILELEMFIQTTFVCMVCISCSFDSHLLANTKLHT